MYNLNQHTELLSGLIFKADTGEKIRKANDDLLVALLNLLLKVNGRLESFESLERSSDGLDEVLLDLSWDVRPSIVDTLITNHHIALLEQNHRARLLERCGHLRIATFEFEFWSSLW